MTQARFYSNEELCRLAEFGTVAEQAAADRILRDRGNVLNADYTITKTVKGSQLYNQPDIAADDVVEVTNGRITSVNGNPWP